MIREDYCSFEIVKLLREKGFKCGATYSKGFVKDGDGFVGGLVRHEDKITHQIAMKWMREVHKIFVEVSVCIDTNGDYHYHSMALDKICEYILPSIGTYDTYEEAVEATLKYVLENLI